MNSHSTNAKSDVFLATADLDQLWDYLARNPSREITLLNPCCLKRGSPSPELAAKIAGSIPAVWEDLENLDALNAQTIVRYEELLRECGHALNALHGENRSDRYWRILIGPWLHFMVSVGYDRLSRLRQAFAACPSPRALGLHESSWLVPIDTLDFQLRVSEDSFNLQIASQIMSLLGVDYEKLPVTQRAQPLKATAFAGQGLAARISRRFMSRLRSALSQFEARRSHDRICVVDTHFSRAQEAGLLLRSGGGICLNLDTAYPREASVIDSAARAMLHDSIAKTDDDRRVLAGLIRDNMPQCFVENYRAIADRAVRNHQQAVPKLIFSTNGWNYSEAFKQWAAGCAERGTVLAGFQHGGGYGRVRLSYNQRHETRILDRFYTWGWSNDAENVVPMYFPYTPAAAPVAGKSAEILYVTTAYPRYFLEIAGPPSTMADNLQWQQRFVAGLSDRVRSLLRVRMYPHDHGWGTAARWHDAAPDIVVEDCRIPFRQRMASCELCICDHPGTTNFEVLAYNVPTLFFWDPAISFFYSDVERDYDELRRAGILYDTPEAAAAAAVAISGAAARWWQEPARQAVRTRFAERYTRSTDNYIATWARELQAAAKRASRGCE